MMYHEAYISMPSKLLQQVYDHTTEKTQKICVKQFASFVSKNKEEKFKIVYKRHSKLVGVIHITVFENQLKMSKFKETFLLISQNI